MHSQKFRIQPHEDEGVETNRSLHYKKVVSDFDINLERAHFGKRKKQQKKKIDLQGIVFKHKVRQHVCNFIKKLKKNSVFRSPCQNQHTEKFVMIKKNTLISVLQNLKQNVSKKQGLSIGNVGLIIWSLINIFQITFMVFVFSIIITFPQTQNFCLFSYMRILSIGLYIIDMILNFAVKRYEKGQYLQKIGQIAHYYFRNQFIIDLFSILVFPIDVVLTVQTNTQMFLFLFAMFKLLNNIKKFDKFQYLFVNSTGKQQYFGLVKVFIANFAIAHFLSIILNYMAEFDSQQSWHSKIQIVNSQWYIKYIWGYYWGTNIMLTVGFGDLCATNYHQAILLIFIETFSCITLAYNINYVGSLINSLRENEKIKKRKLKIFHRMCKQNLIPNQMESKVANFIQEQHRIKQSYEYDTHDQILKEFPQAIQKDFRKAANKNLFQNLSFFSNISKKGLSLLAQKISRKVCHPQQIILRRGQISQMLVLQNGSLSLTCKIRSRLEGKQIQKIQVCQNQKPIMISLNFIRNKILEYNITSNSYSVLFYLSRDDFMKCLRSNQFSFETICMIRDRDNIIQNFEIHNCSICVTQKHNKFECSRLHFTPLNLQVIYKYLHKQNKSKQKRINFQRKKHIFSVISIISRVNFDQKRYISQYFDDFHYKQAQNLQKFYNIKHNQNQIQQLNSSMKRASNEMFASTMSNLKILLDNKQLNKLQKLIKEQALKNQLQFWDIQIDQAQNFKFYFKNGNPQELGKANKKGNYKRSKHVIFNF